MGAGGGIWWKMTGIGIQRKGKEANIFQISIWGPAVNQKSPNVFLILEKTKYDFGQITEYLF